ncbi:MAG: hypothetical protein KBT35_01320 [Firmicutes bacterium]|nr:hypothetical protein [Candidatus Colivicinus equi]
MLEDLLNYIAGCVHVRVYEFDGMDGLDNKIIYDCENYRIHNCVPRKVCYCWSSRKEPNCIEILVERGDEGIGNCIERTKNVKI